MKSFASAILFFAFIFLAGVIFFRQDRQFTYRRDIAPIIQKNCVACHNEDGAGGFSLLTYEAVKKRAGAIKEVTTSGYMPPWKADPDYRHFPGERSLTKEQISIISKWVDDGMYEGKDARIVSKNVVTENKISLKPDYEFNMDQPVCVEGNTHDRYILYPYFLNNSTELNIRNFELSVQNKKIVHHAWIYVVDRKTAYCCFPEWKTKVSAKIRSDLDMPFNEKDMISYFLYLPGKTNVLHVRGTSKKIPADAVLVIDIHYFNKSNQNECDKSVLRVYKADETENRNVSFEILEESCVVDKAFIIPPDTLISFVMKAPPLKKDYTILKITPHMHFLGKSMKVFAVTSASDTIPLVKINAWDFNWQETYAFSPLIKLPKGTVVFAEAFFDNTSGNPMNPSIPPVEVHQGFRSKDEMFQIGLEVMPYERGDEYLRPE